MNETENKAAVGGENNPAGEQKTFTQEDVNRIVGERLAKEKARLETDIVQREQALQQREFMLTAKIRLQERGLPLELLDALNTTSEEAFDASIAIMEQLKTKKEEATDTGSQRPAIGTGSAGDFRRRSFSADTADPVRQAMGLPQQ